MGSLFSSPKATGKSEEQVAAEKAEQERLAKSEADEKSRQADQERKRKANLLGRRSLQDEGVEGFVGYRRKQMGGSKPQTSGSIRN